MDRIQPLFSFQDAHGRAMMDLSKFTKDAESWQKTLSLGSLGARVSQSAPFEEDGLTGQAEVKGEIDEKGRPALVVKAEGEMVFRCQRCLAPVSYPLSETARLTVFDNESDLEEAEEREDGLEGVVLGPDFDPQSLIEDTLILCLPYAPTHPVGTCHAFGMDPNADAETNRDGNDRDGN